MVYKISEINNLLRRTINDNYFLKNISITGEISQCKADTKGNYYIDVIEKKENNKQDLLRTIVFAGRYEAVKLIRDIQDKKEKFEGKIITATGDLSYYQSAISFNIVSIKIDDSEGEYNKKLKELEKKYEAKGYFDNAHKKAIPVFCFNIGLITSKEGAARNDVYEKAKEKNKYCNIVFRSTAVQGEMAEDSIVEKIEELDKLNLDVILLVRGGGSAFDLRAYQSEKIIEAVYNAKTPIVTGIGHQDDKFIVDKVADRSEGTPSHAIDSVLKTDFEIHNMFTMLSNDMFNIVKNRLDYHNNLLNKFRLNITESNPQNKLNLMRNFCKEYSKNFDLFIEKRIDNYKLKKLQLVNLLENKNPKFKIEYLKKELAYSSDKLNNIVDKKVDKVNSQLLMYVNEFNKNSPIEKLKGGTLIPIKDNKYVVSTKSLNVGDEFELYSKDEILTVTLKGKVDNNILAGSDE